MIRAFTLLGYVVLAALGVGLEVRARRRGSATLGDAMSVLLRQWPLRVVVLTGWIWLGWHVFVRVDW